MADSADISKGLPRIIVQRKTGEEPFRDGSRPLGYSLKDFWRWSVSDIVSNATRGVLAEYIVAKALGISTDCVRDECAAHDLEMVSPVTGKRIRIQVKSAA